MKRFWLVSVLITLLSIGVYFIVKEVTTHKETFYYDSNERLIDNKSSYTKVISGHTKGLYSGFALFALLMCINVFYEIATHSKGKKDAEAQNEEMSGLKRKKIVAREFLLFISALVLVGIFYGSIVLYSFYHENRKEHYLKLKIKPELKIHEINESIKDKTKWQEWYYTLVSSNYKVEKTSAEEWEHMSNNVKNIDSFNYRYYKKWTDGDRLFFKEHGLNSPSAIRNFIENNSYTKDEKLIRDSIQIYQKEIDSIYESISKHEDKIIEKDDLVLSLVISLCIAFGILYPIRFLILAFLWSIKVLKKNK